MPHHTRLARSPRVPSVRTDSLTRHRVVGPDPGPAGSGTTPARSFTTSGRPPSLQEEESHEVDEARIRGRRAGDGSRRVRRYRL